jgi:adenylate cyclase class IV
MTRELTVPVAYAATREILTSTCPAPKRSQIDDTLYRRTDGALARLRRQDTVTRLSCTRPDIGLPDAPETIVLDHQASRRLLELLGFEAADRVRFVRETWRSCQYLLHLDRVEGLGDYITVQAEQGSYPPKIYRRLALKQLRAMGIRPAWSGVDSPEALPYTASITRAASAAS